jgi:hypothetical protein
MWKQLAKDVFAKNNANLTEGTIQAASQATHSGRSCEGNQGKNQKVFHQTLASLIFVQAGKGIQNKNHHGCSLLGILLR